MVSTLKPRGSPVPRKIGLIEHTEAASLCKCDPQTIEAPLAGERGCHQDFESPAHEMDFREIRCVVNGHWHVEGACFKLHNE